MHMVSYHGLICILLVTDDVEFLFKCLFAIRGGFMVKCLFKSSACFLIGLFAIVEF